MKLKIDAQDDEAVMPYAPFILSDFYFDIVVTYVFTVKI